MTHRRRPMIGLILIGLVWPFVWRHGNPGPRLRAGRLRSRRVRCHIWCSGQGWHGDPVHVRGRRHPRPDVRRNRRRPGSVHQHVRPAVRPRSPGQPDPAARERDAKGLRGRAHGHDRDPQRSQVQRRDAHGRRVRRVEPRTPSDVRRLPPQERARQRLEDRSVRRERHRAHAEQARLLARGHPERSRRHDHVAGQITKLGKDFGTSPVCVGPFKFVERVVGDHITLARSTDYYDAEHVYLDKIVYKPIQDETVRTANLRSNDLQLVDRVATTDVAALQADTKYVSSR